MPPPTLNFSRDALRPGDRVCVAVSGGADSVALLLAVHSANLAKHSSLGVGLSAVHVNHGLRGAESDGDQRFVEGLCSRLDLPLHLHQASVPDRIAEARAAGDPETIEEAARNVRYEFFTGLLSSGQADAILTAHTLDDQAETVLMKLLRGAWTEGLSGIHPILTSGRGKILRPLLQTSRAEVEGYLQATGQIWREDSSNTDAAYTRNRMRHNILPLLRMENPSFDQTLANLAELAREEEARWQTELARVLPQLLLPGKPVRGGGRSVSTAPGESSNAMELERLRSLDPALRPASASRCSTPAWGANQLRRDQPPACSLRFPDNSDGFLQTGICFELSNQLVAERSPRELRLSRVLASNP